MQWGLVCFFLFFDYKSIFEGLVKIDTNRSGKGFAKPVLLGLGICSSKEDRDLLLAGIRTKSANWVGWEGVSPELCGLMALHVLALIVI